jgi:hypothetical protein
VPYVVDDASALDPEAVAAYNKIIANTGDIAQISQNTGIPEDILAAAKQHLFVDTHEIAIAPGVVETGRFQPALEYADLWNRATNTTLNQEQLGAFKDLVSHEYVESQLMRNGFPYRSADALGFDVQGTAILHPDALGAHYLAPNNLGFAHYGHLGLSSSGLEINNNLSNLDAIIKMILKQVR